MENGDWLKENDKKGKKRITHFLCEGEINERIFICCTKKNNKKIERILSHCSIYDDILRFLVYSKHVRLCSI